MLSVISYKRTRTQNQSEVLLSTNENGNNNNKKKMPERIYRNPKTFPLWLES